MFWRKYPWLFSGTVHIPTSFHPNADATFAREIFRLSTAKCSFQVPEVYNFLRERRFQLGRLCPFSSKPSELIRTAPETRSLLRKFLTNEMNRICHGILEERKKHTVVPERISRPFKKKRTKTLEASRAKKTTNIVRSFRSKTRF